MTPFSPTTKKLNERWTYVRLSFISSKFCYEVAYTIWIIMRKYEPIVEVSSTLYIVKMLHAVIMSFFLKLFVSFIISAVRCKGQKYHYRFEYCYYTFRLIYCFFVFFYWQQLYKKSNHLCHRIVPAPPFLSSFRVKAFILIARFFSLSISTSLLCCCVPNFKIY